MSHILHFYHLAALDYVDARAAIQKGPFCPTYDNSYFARGIDPVGGVGYPVYTVNDPAGNLVPSPAPLYRGDLTHYLAGQYVRALKFRRMAHQLACMFLGKVPHASAFTPGWLTTHVPSDIQTTSPIRTKLKELLYKGPDGSGSYAAPHQESLLGFIGKPGDFLNWAVGGYLASDLPPWAIAGVPGAAPAGTPWATYTGTYLFDVVAVAHLFPEYFWIGTGYGRLLAYGAYEGAATDCGFGGAHADDRLCMRGRTHINPSPAGPGPVQLNNHGMNHLKIREMVDFSRYKDAPGKERHPWGGKTKAHPTANASGYTYAKTPRYKNDVADWPEHPAATLLPYEVGPLARMCANLQGLSSIPPSTGEIAAVLAGDRMAYYPGVLKDLGYALTPGYGDPPPAPAALAHLYGVIPNIAGFPSNYIGDATLDRHAARAIETLYVAKNLWRMFSALVPGGASNTTKTYIWGGKPNQKVPKKAKGVGLTEAPRGALGHWIKVGLGTTPTPGKVSKYQIITPTAWNVSPLDKNGYHGPIERCLEDTPLLDNNQPVEILRVVHSFDCCIACTVHVVRVKDGKKVKLAEAPSGISQFDGTCRVKK